MKQNNNFFPLPWYNSLEQQNHRMFYAFGHIYPLITPANKLLPFQIIRQHRNSSIYWVRLYNTNDEFVIDITQNIKETGLEIISGEEYDVIFYPSTLPMPTNISDGQYYAKMYDGTETWFSEVFSMVHDMSKYLKIVWYNEENIVLNKGQIIYENPSYRNILYFCSELGKPEYNYEEEGKTRNGLFFPEKQLSKKIYKCTILAPEYLCDVLRLIPLADYIRITDKYEQVYWVDTFSINPEWQVQGDLASVEIEFQTDTVIKNLGKGYILTDTGDFNDDYNDDYDNV